MLNRIFKKEKPTEKNIVELEKEKELVKEETEYQQKPEMDKKIEEIHESFYTEVDRLLEVANIKEKDETIDNKAIEKAKKLSSLGFEKAKPAQIGKEHIKKDEKIKTVNKEKKELIKAINYYSKHYPQYKFITQESVEKICKKYGLVYGEASKYIGDVPDKNIEAIENFKLRNQDKLFFELGYMDIESGTNMERLDELNAKWNDEYTKATVDYERIIHKDETYIIAPFEIVAPEKDFDKFNLIKEGYELKDKPVPDPVVLQPVFWGDRYNRIKHYLIVTAWGKEASDELVNNPNHS